MGKGIIKSGGDDGLYDVELTLHKDRVDDTIAIIDARIEVLTTKIDAMEEGDAKELEKLRRASYQKRKDYINDNLPEDHTVSAWCGDLTEDLSGNVGTIEIPGERGVVQIQPGYEGEAAYNAERDGQLQPSVAGTPESVFYNLAMLPGWQKWMPTYRHGIISNIDTDNDTCDVALDVVESSQQGLAVNQESNLSGIPIEYMSCNSSAFEDGDAVLVKFEGQEWSGAKVIGFKEDPKACCFSKPFTETDFTWEGVATVTGDAIPSYVTGPTGPLDFSVAFDKPSGAPHPAIFQGGGGGYYRILELDLAACNYLIFKLDAVNIIKDLTGWSKSCAGSITLSYSPGGDKQVVLLEGAEPGLYYKDISDYKDRKVISLYIMGSGYTACYDNRIIHHEVNMTFDYIKMSNEIPEGGTEVIDYLPPF